MRTALAIFVILGIVLPGCGGGASQKPDEQPADTSQPAAKPAANPDDPDAALADMEAASDGKRRQEDDLRRKEEARRKMEAEKKGMEGVGAREGAGDDKPLFEERFADIIGKVRAELQKYKRW